MITPEKYILISRKMKQLVGHLKSSEWETLFKIMIFCTPQGTVSVELKDGSLKPSNKKDLSTFFLTTDKTLARHMKTLIDLGVMKTKKGARTSICYTTTNEFFTCSIEEEYMEDYILIERAKLLTMYKKLQTQLSFTGKNGMERKLFPFSYFLVGLIHSLDGQPYIVCQDHKVNVRYGTKEGETKILYSIEDMQLSGMIRKMKLWSMVSGKQYKMSSNQKEVFDESLRLLEEHEYMFYVDGQFKFFRINDDFFTYS
ncbi:hypothetical protein [Bacillus cereus]|uniref:hypothetical protein n=1 Tax=Bacillus cereus TaxID=1396 RepID=UPI000BED0315|nr:hypothetical protein [Bacillus cereus]PDY82768.1 hypothetical protein CON06_10210 [Bacillus cereus]